jgi:hypothetical protein
MVRSFIPFMLVAVFAAGVFAQTAPFVYPGATVAEPQISYVGSGAQDAVGGAVVSQDRKYVTLDINPQFSTVQRFVNFSYQTASGFVGSTPIGGVGAGTAANGLTATTAPKTFLDRPGMTLVSPLPVHH